MYYFYHNAIFFVYHHFRILAKSHIFPYAFHLRMEGVLWPVFLFNVVGMVWR